MWCLPKVVLSCLALSFGIQLAKCSNYNWLLRAQFLNMSEMRISLRQFPEETPNFLIEQADEKEWYKSKLILDEGEVKKRWTDITRASEMTIRNSEHVFKSVTTSFPIQIYGQRIHNVTLTSAGAIITSNKINNLEIPNHIAPLLTTRLPSNRDNILFLEEEGNLIVQWTHHIDDTDEHHKVQFQAKISSNGDITFVYKTFLTDIKKIIRNFNYPILVGLQNGFANHNITTTNNNRDESYDLKVHKYPSLMVNFKHLLLLGTYSAIEFKPIDNRCWKHKDNVECKAQDGCTYCNRIGCINKLEMNRPGTNCEARSTQRCSECKNNDFAPVCGSDGILYPNTCQLELASCRRGSVIEIAADKVCSSQDLVTKKVDEDPDMWKDCTKSPCKSVNPVCGNDGQTYSSECSLYQINCRLRTRVTVAKLGRCQEDETNGFPDEELPNDDIGDDDDEILDDDADCSSSCTMAYRPVCGSNGNTYSNMCLLNYAICKDPSLTLSIEGPCPYTTTSKAVKGDCKFGCTRELKPVCGTNGKTYPNMCELDLDKCRYGNVEFLFDGTCCKNCTENIKSRAESAKLKYTEIIGGEFGEAEKSDTFLFAINHAWSRGFRLVLACGAVIITLSIVGLFFAILHHHRRHLRHEVSAFTEMKSSPDNIRSFWKRQHPPPVELGFVTTRDNGQVKYDRLPLFH